MRPPTVDSINLDGYRGKLGQVIRVKATDDFRVVEVKVTIRGPAGELIEEGMAELSPDDGERRVALYDHDRSAFRAVGFGVGDGQR